MNATDATESNNGIGKLTGGLQLGYALDSGSAYLNFLYGRQGADDEELFQVDLTTGWDISEQFYLGLNASYQDTDGSGFYGVALYPQYAITDAFSLGLRAEYFETTEGFGIDDDGFETIFGLDNEGEGNVFAATLTGSYTQGALTIKPELRLDSTSEDSFLDNDGDPSDSLASFVLGAVFAF